MTTAEEILSRHLVWDTHSGMFPAAGADLAGLAAYRRAGVGHVALCVGFDALPWSAAIETLSDYRRALRDDPDIALVSTVAEVEAARAAGRMAVSFDIEGAEALNGDPGMVAVYRALGVNQMLLAYNLNTLAAGGCHDFDDGLTPFGRQVVAEMNRAGMIVDATHMGYRSAAEVLEISASPVIFSHSNPRAVWDHERNIPDDLIRACADQGGVVGINGIGIFLGPNVDDAESFVRHITHVADLVGPDHVALGFDWVPPSRNLPDLSEIVAQRPDFWPRGKGYDAKPIRMVAPSALPQIVGLLIARGWDEPALAALLGGNMARVARASWGG